MFDYQRVQFYSILGGYNAAFFQKNPISLRILATYTVINTNALRVEYAESQHWPICPKFSSHVGQSLSTIGSHIGRNTKSIPQCGAPWLLSWLPHPTMD